MKKTVKDIDVKGKRVICRCDFNVPMKDGVITDTNRITAALPTIKYLLENGVPEDDIIVEDQSRTTYENLKFSKKILDSMDGRKYTALVTSNYHVYRALRYCREVGLKCTGIGSRVAFYYWPSALIREFIAIHAEKKHALIFFIGWLICMIMTYIVMI